MEAAESILPLTHANICDGVGRTACEGQDAIVHIAAAPNP